MQGDHWLLAMVAHLQRSKRVGVPFDAAWRDAIRANPPEGEGDDGTLFDADGRPHENPMVPFLRRVAESAYNDVEGKKGSGHGRAIRDFRPEMLMGSDASEPARRVRRLAA
jgi:hypothetical protein